MAEIKLVSSDAKEFIVPLDVAQKSVTLKTMLQDLGLEDGKDFRFRFRFNNFFNFSREITILFIIYLNNNHICFSSNCR